MTDISVGLTSASALPVAVPATITITEAPSITGIPAVGQTLTGVDGAATGDGETSVTARQWLRGSTVIATGGTYDAVSADGGATITYRVTWSDGSTTRAATSAGVEIPTIAPTPSISINTELVVGDTLQVAAINVRLNGETSGAPPLDNGATELLINDAVETDLTTALAEGDSVTAQFSWSHLTGDGSITSDPVVVESVADIQVIGNLTVSDTTDTFTFDVLTACNLRFLVLPDDATPGDEDREALFDGTYPGIVLTDDVGTFTGGSDDVDVSVSQGALSPETAYQMVLVSDVDASRIASIGFTSAAAAPAPASLIATLVYENIAGSVNSAVLTDPTCNLNTLNSGSADGDFMVVSVMARDGQTDRRCLGVTFDGIPAALLAETEPSGNNRCYVGHFGFIRGLTAQAPLIVTMDNPFNDVCCIVRKVPGASPTLHDSFADRNGAEVETALNGLINTLENGCLIAAGVGHNEGGSYVPSGVATGYTQSAEVQKGGRAIFVNYGFRNTVTETADDVVVGYNWNDPINLGDKALCVISLGLAP